jgi:cytochrome P450
MSETPSRPPVSDWVTDLDHFDPGFVADPYPIYADLREQCPITHSDRYGGMTWLTRAEDVATVVHDTETFSSRRITISEIPTKYDAMILPPINLDPPEHGDRRRLLLPFFSPRLIAEWEQPIRDICQRLLDGLEGQTEFDAACEYAQEIPGEITAQMLGVPTEDTPQFRTWLHDLLEVGPTNVPVARRTTEAMIDYMLQLIKQRRTQGSGDDLVSFLMEQEIDGELLSDDEMARTLFLVLIAGIDTTWSAIGFSLLHLAENPDDRRRLVADPSLMPTAVEEFLRAYSPVYIARVATRDTELGGCPIPEGEWAVLAFPATNRDPELFENPDEVDLGREQNRHAAFGLGVHRCLGSNLARLEMAIAIEMWMDRFPDFTLTDPSAVTFAAGHVRGPRAIPIRIG